MVGPIRFVPQGGKGHEALRPSIIPQWRQQLSRGIDLSRSGTLKEAQGLLASAYTAGKTAFSRIPLPKALELAKVTHNAYFEGVDKPLIADPNTIFVDPNNIVPETAAQLKVLLTAEGQTEIDKFISGTHIGKAFLVPAHILPGKVSEFLAFFGKTDKAAITNLQALVDSGDRKKKVANNQSMDWDSLTRRIDRIYLTQNNEAMKQYEVSLQIEAILDSAIAIAARQQGVIRPEQIYEIYHVLWATHNDWQQMATVNYANLDAKFGAGTAK